MPPTELTAEINMLSVAQKLILAQDIWDSIAKDGENLPLPEWQRNELDRRYKDYQQGKSTLHNWRDVHGELRAIYK